MNSQSSALKPKALSLKSGLQVSKCISSTIPSNICKRDQLWLRESHPFKRRPHLPQLKLLQWSSKNTLLQGCSSWSITNKRLNYIYYQFCSCCLGRGKPTPPLLTSFLNDPSHILLASRLLSTMIKWCMLSANTFLGSINKWPYL